MGFKEVMGLLKISMMMIMMMIIIIIIVIITIIIIWATGTISKSLRQYLSNIILKHKFKEL